MLHKILSLIASVAVLMAVMAISPVARADSDGTITVETTTAATGETVFVDLTIKDNPGIMAVTVSVTYDPDALEFVQYFYGDVFTDYTVAAHPARKLIRLVISEKKDKTDDGTVVRFEFKVKEDAQVGMHEMTVEYAKGDFCNYDLVRLMPTIVPGGVDVKFNGTNCSHKAFGEWKTEIPPTCFANGVEQRLCKTCPHTETRSVEKIGHTFSDKFTVDVPATKDSPGKMSRHCIRCDATTNSTVFTLEESEKGNIDNKEDAEVPENEVIKDIIQQQNPDLNKPPASQDEPASQPEGSPSDGKQESSNNETTSQPTTTEPDSSDVSDTSSDLEKTETSKSDKTTIAKKLSEVIPELRNILKIILIALVVLIVVILI